MVICGVKHSNAEKYFKLLFQNNQKIPPEGG